MNKSSTHSKKSRSALKVLAQSSSSLGCIIPGYAYFNLYSPPLFENISLLTSAVVLSVVVYVTKHPDHKSGIGFSFFWIILAILIMFSYSVARELTTTSIPSDYEIESAESVKRLQIGFNLAPWSLTEKAKKYASENNINTVSEIVLWSGYSQENMYKAWSAWSINAASFLLMLLFFSGFILWAYGFSKLSCALSSG